MKALYLLLILLSAVCCSLSAQEAEKTERIDTLTVNGNVYYYYPEVTREIYSGKNKIKIDKACEDFYVNQDIGKEINGIVKKVFSKERIQELAENKYSVGFKLYCNIKGEILEVNFFLLDSEISYKGDRNSLSLNEIDLLNKEVKNYKFDLRQTCPDVKYYVVWWGIVFSKYVNK